VDLVVKAFLDVRDRLPDAGTGWRESTGKGCDANRSNGVIATGGVSPAELERISTRWTSAFLRRELRRNRFRIK